MDVLDDILETLALRGVLYFRTDFSAPFAVTVPDLAGAARFHLVLEGMCHVEIVGGPSVALGPGDMVMVPRGRAHVLADRSGRNARPLEAVLAEAGYDGDGVLTLRRHDEGAATQMVCGHFSFHPFARHPLIDALPGHIVITAAARLRAPWLDEVLRMIGRRVFSESLAPGGAVRRLSEIVFTEVIRAGIAQDPALGLVADGFRDPQIGRALQLIHRSPERAWSVASLAAEAGMSRSAFAERFRSLIGQGPVGYLADWRLQKSLVLLDDPRIPIQKVATRAGYLSAAAFSRAFSARFGMAPSTYRRTAPQAA